MEVSKQIEGFIEFYESIKDKVLESFRLKKQFLYIDFSKLSKQNPDLANELLDDPEEVLQAAKIAIEKVVTENVKDFKIRVTNLPNSCKIPIWEIRKDLKRFIKVEGYLTELGRILIRPIAKKYECPSCGNIITILRHDEFSKIPEPTKCGCGKKGKLRLFDSVTINVRKVVIEEDMMQLNERQSPRTKVVLLKYDLVGTEMDEQLIVGKKLLINGWLNTYIVDERNEDMDTYLHANSIEFLNVGWSTIKLSKKEEDFYKEFVKNKDFKSNMKQSIMPGIHGEEEVKEALLLQLVGSNNITDKDGYLHQRGCIHIALIGNPGSGKTVMLKYIGKFWPIYRFTSAITSTGRGLIAIVDRDKQLNNQWVLIPGVIPTCSNGLTSIDELDKMNKDDYGYLNNAMNDLKIYIDKAAKGILETDTSLLCSLNPRGRVFIFNEPIHSQIELPPDLLDRFDIIIPVFAKVNEEDQRRVFRIGLNKRNKDKEVEPIYDTKTVIKFIAYSRTIIPRITEEMGKIIEDRLMKFMRNPNEEAYISNRIFDTIFRLVCAEARLNLREEVTVEDLNAAMDILIYSYKQQGLITSDGLLDFERVERVDEMAANIHTAVKEFINAQEQKEISIQDIVEELKEKFDVDRIEETIEKMKRVGDIYEPKYGIVMKVG